MKAERRHELNENTLATQATRVVKVMQLPDERNKWLGRAALAIAIVLLIAALVRSRINSAENSRRAAGDHLQIALNLVRGIRWQVPGSNLPLASAFMEFVQKTSEEANAELDQVMSLTDDAKIVGQATLIRGDLNFALANEPVLPPPATASTQPIVTLKQTREEYLSQAAAAYGDVLGKYAGQPINVISAHFGLAAIAENRSKWDEAGEHYQAIAMNPESSPSVKLLATQQREQLTKLKQPALLEKGPTMPLVAATQPVVIFPPATTQSAPAPAKLAATAPATKPAAPATQPATAPK